LHSQQHSQALHTSYPSTKEVEGNSFSSLLRLCLSLSSNSWFFSISCHGFFFKLFFWFLGFFVWTFLAFLLQIVIVWSFCLQTLHGYMLLFLFFCGRRFSGFVYVFICWWWWAE
jgi:hypothetical protein